MKRRHATRLAGRARPGDVVVLEATEPLTHEQRRGLKAELHDLSELTGVAFVVADHGLKVHVARPRPRPGAGRRTG